MNRAIAVTVAIGILYLLVCLCVFLLQRGMLYYPSKMSANAAAELAAQNGFTPWMNANGQIIGWKITSAGSSAGSVLITHGNAGSAAHRDYIARPIHEAAQLDVFVLEYPGYGARAGSPSKASFMAAAEEAFKFLPQGPKYLVSESIGTGVASELAKNHPDDVRGLALLVPYHRLA